jgi:hypothetical protein
MQGILECCIGSSVSKVGSRVLVCSADGVARHGVGAFEVLTVVQACAGSDFRGHIMHM